MNFFSSVLGLTPMLQDAAGIPRTRDRKMRQILLGWNVFLYDGADFFYGLGWPVLWLGDDGAS